MLSIDHAVLAVADLDGAGERIFREHGLASVPGGVHPAWGTANRIIPMGADYLELISVVDPRSPAPRSSVATSCGSRRTAMTAGPRSVSPIPTWRPPPPVSRSRWSPGREPPRTAGRSAGMVPGWRKASGTPTCRSSSAGTSRRTSCQVGCRWSIASTSEASSASRWRATRGASRDWLGGADLAIEVIGRWAAGDPVGHPGDGRRRNADHLGTVEERDQSLVEVVRVDPEAQMAPHGPERCARHVCGQPRRGVVEPIAPDDVRERDRRGQ